MFNYPDITGSVAPPQPDPRETVIVTGSAAKKEPPKEAPKESGAQSGKPAKDAATDKPAGKDAAKSETPQQAKPGAASRPVDLAARPEGARVVSSAERAILGRLQERRQELEARARGVGFAQLRFEIAEIVVLVAIALGLR